MTRRNWLPLLLAMIMTMGSILPAAAQRPDPHSRENAHPRATAAASSTSESGCDLVESYATDLYERIDDSGSFADFFYSEDEFGDISATDAEKVIKDGDAMIAELNDLDVPPPYAEAHKNIVLFFQINIDIARFYGIDSSVVPDITAYDSALTSIEEGEQALAKACPDEVDAIGGYILVDPADNQKPVDPESIPK